MTQAARQRVHGGVPRATVPAEPLPSREECWRQFWEAAAVAWDHLPPEIQCRIADEVEARARTRAGVAEDDTAA